MTEARDAGKSLSTSPEHFAGLSSLPATAKRRRSFTPNYSIGSFTDNPIGPGMVYTMLKQNGKEVGALYQMTPEMAAGVPPNWISYVSVTSADEMLPRLKNLAGP